MISQSFEVEGHYCLRIKNHKTGKIRQIGPFKNLITNMGLNSFGGNPRNYNLNNCFVGTSTTPPAVTDTDLGAKIGALSSNSTATLGVNEGAPNYSSLLTMQYNFAVGAVVGNISEVGVGNGTLSGTNLTIQYLFSRSLIVDANGNPITITIFADESLTVLYYLRAYPNLTDGVQIVTDQTTGIEHTLTSRIYNCATFRNTNAGILAAIGGSANDTLLTHTQTNTGTPVALAPITAAAPFTGSTNVTGGTRTTSQQPYVADSFTRTSTVALNLAAGNATNGIHGLVVQASTSAPGAIIMGTQILVQPPIMKTAQNTLAIDLSISWSRRT